VKQEGGGPVNWEYLQSVCIPFCTDNPLCTFCALGAMRINELIIRISVIIFYLRSYWTEIDCIWHRGSPLTVRAYKCRSRRSNIESTSRERYSKQSPSWCTGGTTITLGRTPLDDWSARSRDFYMTTHNIHKRQPCPRRYSNPQPQQANGHRPTPWPRGHYTNCTILLK
jgi:hypothetical protein